MHACFTKRPHLDLIVILIFDQMNYVGSYIFYTDTYRILLWVLIVLVVGGEKNPNPKFGINGCRISYRLAYPNPVTSSIVKRFYDTFYLQKYKFL